MILPPSCIKLQKELHQSTHSLFEKCHATHSYNTRSARNGHVVTPKMNSAKGQTAFVYSGAHVWNNLPSHLKEAQSVDIFQDRLKEHILTNDLTW